ncbi:MAG TPA: hypothetical protein VF814_06625 [Casimicrobiaceae bacterium]
MPADIVDPRVFPDTVDAAHAPLIELARASLAAGSAIRAEEIDRALTSALVDRLRSGEASFLAEVVAAAPSPPIARALWRCLIDAWAQASRAGAAGVAATLFAQPVVVVAAREPGAESGEDPLAISGVLADTERLAAIMREHGALAGNPTLAFAPALVASDAIDLPRLTELLAWQRLATEAAEIKRDLPPTPIALQSGQQSVHLRFLVGTALAAPGVGLLSGSAVGGWAMPLARELARQLARPEVSVLALPRAPQPPPAALQQGRCTQREVGAQLFASNAIRKLRSTVGEPSAVISAHRCVAAPGGGELRLSLSSPFDPRQAEGFRCPLFPTDRAGDVATMLLDLLRDCRVTDVRILPGVHPDRDPETGMPLLFKPDAAARVGPTTLH